MTVAASPGGKSGGKGGGDGMAAPRGGGGTRPYTTGIPDRSNIASTIFDRNMSMMRPDMERSQSRLLTNLQARGIPIGSEAFNDAYGDQVTRTQETISRLAQDADMAAGAEQSREFGLNLTGRQQSLSELAALMGGGYAPPSSAPSGAAAGVNYGGMVGDKYRADMAQWQSDRDASMATAGTLGSLASGLFKMSDRRLKRDIRLIGQRGGLNLYEYRYIWDASGTIRRGFMAQEVLLSVPQAVAGIGRWLALDYSKLPEVE